MYVFYGQEKQLILEFYKVVIVSGLVPRRARRDRQALCESQRQMLLMYHIRRYDPSEL